MNEYEVRAAILRLGLDILDARRAVEATVVAARGLTASLGWPIDNGHLATALRELDAAAQRLENITGTTTPRPLCIDGCDSPDCYRCSPETAGSA